MNYLKKSLIVFFPLLMSLFLIKGYISTKNFSETLETILNSSGLNVEFDKVRLEKFNKLRIDNLKVKDMDGNVVIDSRKTTANLSLLMPSRLLRIDVYDATVNLERSEGNDFNIFHVIKPSDKENQPIDRTSRIGKLYIHDATLNYSDISYEKKIEKTMEKINGYLEYSKSRGFILEAKGVSGTEGLGIKVGSIVDTLQSFKSMFDIKKNYSEERKNFFVDFDFKNINVTEELGQYVPLDIIKVKGGLLNGNLSLDNRNPKKTTKVKGYLTVKEGHLSYSDYDGDIRNINATVNMDKDRITVDGATEIREGKVDLDLTYYVDNGKLNLNLATDNVSYDEIARYRILKEANVKAKGNITGNLNIETDQKKKETKLNGRFSSPNINIGGYDFQNIRTEMAISKEQILTLKNTYFYFDESIGGFKIKEDAQVDSFTYDIKNKNGKGSYTLLNKGSDHSIDKTTGSFEINSSNIISGNFLSKEIDGNFNIDPGNQKVIVNADGRGNITVTYNKQTYIVNPDINRLVLNLKGKSIMESGNINARIKLENNSLLGIIDTKVDISEGNYKIDALIDAGGQYIRAKGMTSSEMNHSYTVTTSKNSTFDMAKFLRHTGKEIKGLDKAYLPVTFTARLNGKGSSFSGEYDVYSPYGQFIVEYEELRAKGKISDLLSLNLDANGTIYELWLGYQRLKNVNALLEIKNNILNIINIHNEKITANGKYNLKTGNMTINSNLNNYVVYNTIKPEVNVIVDKASMNVSGTVGSLNGNIILEPSSTLINSRFIGETKGTVNIKDSVLDFKEFTLRENSISGTYDMKTGLADMSLNLNERDIPELLGLKDLTFGTLSRLNLKGDLNDFNLSGEIILGNMSYKGYTLPYVVTEIDYSNGNVDKLFKYGTFDVKKLTILGDNREELFKTSMNFDLENIDVDYRLENQKFSLDSVQDLKNKGYSGDINLNFILKGNPENFFTDLKIQSEELVLSGFPVDNLDIDIQANNEELSIGQFYLEYEQNPLLVNGFMAYSPLKYNMSVLAKEFDLEFLGLNQDIKQANGVADIDILFTNTETKGKVLLNNFFYITKDGKTDVNNVNADINVVNRKLNINRLDGGYNGGTFSIDGNLDVPTIPEDFMKTKRLELGKFEVNATLNNVGLRYGEDIDFALTGDMVFTENNLYGILNVNSGEIRAIPEFGNNTKTTSGTEQDSINKEKTIVEGVVEEVIDKILKQYTVDLSIQTDRNLKINIPNVSLAKNIRGQVLGESRIMYDDGEMSILGNYSVRNGSFVLNGNNFTLDTAEVRFTNENETLSSMNPFVLLEASSNIDGERIEIGMNGYLNNSEITLKSSSGLSKEQILSLLAFNTLTGTSENEDTEDKAGVSTDDANAAILGTLVDTALNQLIFSSVTGKIGETFGLTNLSINTDFKNGTSGTYEGATTVAIQDNLYKDKLFWNLAVKFPFQTSKGVETAANTDPVGYNVWINYNVTEGFGLKAGGETVQIRESNTILNQQSVSGINYYIGIDFSSRADSFSDLMKKIFRKRKLQTLTK